jgi:3'-phosphoadenosine 5'-phosphosulfate (PAPS) 3'-phosphatase
MDEGKQRRFEFGATAVVAAIADEEGSVTVNPNSNNTKNDLAMHKTLLEHLTATFPNTARASQQPDIEFGLPDMKIKGR